MDDNLFDDNVRASINTSKAKDNRKVRQQVQEIDIKILQAKLELEKIEKKIVYNNGLNMGIAKSNEIAQSEMYKYKNQILDNDNNAIENFVHMQSKFNENTVFLGMALFLMGGLMMLFMIEFYINRNNYGAMRNIYLMCGFIFLLLSFHFASKIQNYINKKTAMRLYSKKELAYDFNLRELFKSDRYTIHKDWFSAAWFYLFIVSACVVVYVTFVIS